MEQLLATFSLTPLDAIMIPIGTALFFTLWHFLSKRLFAPYLALVHEREGMTTGATDEARTKSQEVDAALAEIEARSRDARVRAMAKKLETLQAARAQAQKIAESAEQEAASHLKSKREETATEIEALRRSTFAQAEELADVLVRRLEPAAQPTLLS